MFVSTTQKFPIPYSQQSFNTTPNLAKLKSSTGAQHDCSKVFRLHLLTYYQLKLSETLNQSNKALKALTALNSTKTNKSEKRLHYLKVACQYDMELIKFWVALNPKRQS